MVRYGFFTGLRHGPGHISIFNMSEHMRDLLEGLKLGLCGAMLVTLAIGAAYGCSWLMHEIAGKAFSDPSSIDQ